jgi:hypothetical protein
VNDDESRSGEKTPGVPAGSRSHADKCCLLHFSGAGAPPSSSFDDALFRAWRGQLAWSGAPAQLSISWPTLPVGSRAPPISIL